MCHEGRKTFAEADRVMTPLLGRPLSDYIFIDGDDMYFGNDRLALVEARLRELLDDPDGRRHEAAA